MLRQFGLTAILIAACGQAWAAPYTPAHDDIVLESVTPAADPAAREFAALREQLRTNPRDTALAARYAQRAIERGRVLGDPRFYGYADAALQAWSSDRNPPVVIRVLRATLLQQRHDFAGALAELDRALAADPGSAQALLTRAVVHRVQGRLAPAYADCASLDGRAPSAVGLICKASVLHLNGRAQDALQLLSPPGGLTADPELVRWAQSVRAEIHVSLNQPLAAEQEFRAALTALRAARTTDFYLLAAYADFLLDANRPAEVLALLAEFPGTDALLLRQALAAQMLATGGDHGMAARAASPRTRLAERFADSLARGDSSHAREQAWFELRLNNAPAAALKLATQNWRNQHEPLDARLLLEAALATGQAADARMVLDWMDQTRIEDTTLQKLRARIEAQP